MKKAIAILLLLSTLLSLCACAPAEKPEEQPGKSPDTAEPVPPGPAPATPDHEPTKPDTEPEDTEAAMVGRYSAYLNSPVSVPRDYKPDIVSEDPAPETADGLYFGCRGIDFYLTPGQTISYSFYIISRKPIGEDKLDFDSGLEAQESFKFRDITTELLGYKEGTTGGTVFNDNLKPQIV